MQISKETVNKVLKFRDDRDWKQFHDPKDLAISISLEASELLEIFQWSRDDVYCLDKNDKIKLNELKYPVDKAKGTSTKYNEL